MRRLLANITICAGASAIFSLHFFWGLTNGQYVDDTYKDRYFKPIEFEKVHRGVVSGYNTTTGMFNISQCSIDLMTCLEDAPNDLICSFTTPFSFHAFVDTICPLMRERCHDYVPTFQGPFLDFREGACPVEQKESDMEYDHNHFFGK